MKEKMKQEVCTEIKTPLEKAQSFRWEGIPLYLCVYLLGLTLLTVSTGVLGTDFTSILFFLLVFGITLCSIGDKLPIIKDYLGGGPLMMLLIGSWMTWIGIIPEKYVQATNDFMAKVNFQAFFLCILICATIISIQRKVLIKSLLGYLPCILGGLLGAFLLACAVGHLFGLNISSALMQYVMPIMGGGSAAGALPMSEIYSEITGGDKEVYYGIAMSALMVANIMCIAFAVLLDVLGKIFPFLTGDGTQLMRSKKDEKFANDIDDVIPTLQNIAAALVILCSIYVLSILFSKLVLPKIFGIPIHSYAYMVIFATMFNIFKLLPADIRKGIDTLYKFFMKCLGPALFAGMAVSLLDFQSFIDALSPATVVMGIAIIVGAILGSGVVGWFVGFYPVDAAITAGLCMANMGGSGDLLILSAGKRMGLMSYASVSSRIGGAIVLAMAGVIFGMFH